jgi:PAS domain S-box-containing protein
MNLSFLRQSRYVTPAMVLLGLGLSLGVYQTTAKRDADHVRNAMAKEADDHLKTISSKIEIGMESLRGLGDLIAVQPEMAQATFQALARQTTQRQPQFSSINWMPEPASTEGAAYPPVGDSKSSQTPGVDKLEKQLARARQSGQLVTSGFINMPGAHGVESAVAMVQPVRALQTEPGKPGRNLGYIIAHLRVGNLLGDINSTPVTNTRAGLMLLDVTANDSAQPLLIHSDNGAAESRATPPIVDEFRSGWHRECFLNFGERTWLLLFRPAPVDLAAARSSLPGLLLTAGIAITLLTVGLLRELLRRSDLVEQQVLSRTARLQEIQAQLEEDIQQREQTQQLLRASEQQLHGLMENSPGAIYVKDADGRYLAVNRRFTELHGRSREEFLGARDLDLFPPDLAAQVRKNDAQVMAGTEPLEIEESFQLADGVHINLVHKFPLVDDNGAVHGICAIATDITERKRAEAEVRESRRQLESLLGQLPGMAFRFANDGNLTPVYVSRGAAGLTGHTARDFLEKQITLEEIIHPDDRKLVRASVAAAVKKHRSFEIEYRLIDRAGREKWVLERGRGVHDETGALLFIEGLAIDITQRKDAESEKLLVERRLLEGQKLESIGVLAGGIAHDFNNLLTGIIGNANLASLDLPPHSTIRNNLRQIEVASQRAAELCQQMLAYAGKGRFIVQPVELGALVKTTVPLLQASISKRAKLNFDLLPDLPPVMSDPTQLRQIVMNLVLNAAEALGDRDGEIAISTNLVHPAADWFESAPLAPPETNMPFVRLEVRDSGCGMSPETIAKIFEPFFTTKFTGRGLGLAAVLGIIRSHRGGLIVRSVVGTGSIFALFFPAAVGTPTEKPATLGKTNLPWHRDGHILIVDDEEHVLKVAANMLKSSGMTVETAHDGYEALDFFRVNPDAFSLVLLDMTMPRLSGEETLNLLREIRPGIRVLFMSGYNRREVVDALPGRATLGFMQKPFTLESMREHLQFMLG